MWPLRDPQRQALHDKLARTWVVRAGPDAPVPPRRLDPVDETPRQRWLPPQAPRA